MAASGTVTLDFGTFPGKTDATVAVTGQAAIVAGSLVGAWVRPVATTVDYRSRIIADGASAYWRLGEPSGTNANDEVGTLDGTYIGGPTFAQTGALVGDSNTAVLFPTTTFPGRYVDIVGSTVVPAVVSLEAWVKGTAFSDNGLIGWRDAGGVYNSFINLPAGDVIRFYCGDATPVEYSATGVLTNGAWHHVVATYDGTNARIYLDGALVAGPTAKTAPGGASASDMKIGQYGSPSGTAFDASIDEAAVYSVALSAAQVANHYLIGQAVQAEHSADEHRVEDLFVVADTIVAGTGFTIFGRAGNNRLYGAWTCAWAWS